MKEKRRKGDGSTRRSHIAGARKSDKFNYSAHYLDSDGNRVFVRLNGHVRRGCKWR